MLDSNADHQKIVSLRLGLHQDLSCLLKILEAWKDLMRHLFSVPIHFFYGQHVINNLLNNVIMLIWFTSAVDSKNQHASQLRFKKIHFAFWYTLQVGLKILQVLECAAAASVEKSSVLFACIFEWFFYFELVSSVVCMLTAIKDYESRSQRFEYLSQYVS